ncbi:MAG: phospholipid carrier-dependent glycosyltransferase [Anaerolineae bacterium]
MLPRHTLVALYLLLLSVYLLSASGHFFSVDHVHVYLTTQSLVERGSLAIKPLGNSVPAPGGLAYSPYVPAQSLLSIPLYLLGRFVGAVAPPAVQRYLASPGDGDYAGAVPIFFVSLFNQLITPLIAVLVALFCAQMGFSRRAAVGTALVFGLGTLCWVIAREYFQHSLETLAVLAAVYVLFANRERLRPGHALAAGAALAVGILTRSNVLILVPVVLVYLWLLVPTPAADAARPAAAWRAVDWARRRTTAGLPSLVAFGLPLLAALAVLLALNRIKYGHALNFGPQVAPGFSTPLWVGLYGYLLSPGRSVFLYSPPLALAAFAFVEFWRGFRRESLLFLSIGGIYLLVFSSYQYWHGGWSYGPRYLFTPLPFLIIPLAYLFRSWRGVLAVAVFAALGVGVAFLGIALNYNEVYFDWIRMGLVPEDAYLWVPQISAIPTHAADLLAGRYIDLWLVWVYQQFGVGVALLTAAVPLTLLAVAVGLLRDLLSGAGSVPHKAPQTPLGHLGSEGLGEG